MIEQVVHLFDLLMLMLGRSTDDGNVLDGRGQLHKRLSLRKNDSERQFSILVNSGGFGKSSCSERLGMLNSRSQVQLAVDTYNATSA